MKITYQAVLLSAMALALGACSEENPWRADGEGGISLRLNASADVKDAIPVLRGEAPALEAPAPSDFSISLKNLSTDEVQTWATLADFQNQKSFATGSYTLTAFYGNPEDEGFEKPYFTGTADVTVLEARESSVEVTAQLANSMVSVDYTDAFRAYFKDYGVTVHSEGHSYVEFDADETRPAFIAPGEVSISVKVTNPSGKTAVIQPAAFPAAARYHYHLTLNVNTAPMGDAQLQVIFDDSLTQEDVFIDLTDELFSSPAPRVAPEGFTDGQTLELLAGNSAANPLKFNIAAYGGISSAVLTISGDGFTPAFGNEVELVNASAQTQQQLEALGIKAIGLYDNPANLASLDITGLPQHLPTGKFDISLVVKDPFTRISDPVTLHVSTEPVVLEVSDGTAIFNSGQAMVNVAYNGSEPEKNISFEAMSKTGVYKPCQIVNVTESTRTRSFETKNYIFTIALPDTDRDVIPLRVFFGGVQKIENSVNVVIPEYTVDTDAMAKSARVKVNPANSADLAAITNYVKVFVDGTKLPESRIARSPETGIITVSGLNPSTAYSLGTSLTEAAPAEILNITTEAAADVPNGDFSSTVPSVNMTGVRVGGEFTGTVFGNPKYHVSSDIVCEMAEGWSSLNEKTCWAGSSTLNTWFCVPSTYVENGMMTIRSVGFSHAGSVPGLTKKTAVYYCQNSPSFSDAEKCAGELFLGSYSFDGSEHRADGMAFGSRPQYLTFDYSYESVNHESGKVEISVIAADGSVLSTATRNLEAASAMTPCSVALPAYPFGKKAASIRVRFVSSTAGVPYINIPSKEALKEVDGVHLESYTVAANTYHAFARGSVLKVDNVKLNY